MASSRRKLQRGHPPVLPRALFPCPVSRPSPLPLPSRTPGCVTACPLIAEATGHSGCRAGEARASRPRRTMRTATAARIWTSAEKRDATCPERLRAVGEWTASETGGNGASWNHPADPGCEEPSESIRGGGVVAVDHPRRCRPARAAGLLCTKEVFRRQVAGLSDIANVVVPENTGFTDMSALAHHILRSVPDGPLDVAGESPCLLPRRPADGPSSLTPSLLCLRTLFAGGDARTQGSRSAGTSRWRCCACDPRASAASPSSPPRPAVRSVGVRKPNSLPASLD